MPRTKVLASKPQRPSASEGPSNPRPGRRFPSPALKKRFDEHQFQIIRFKIIDQRFFLQWCREVYDIITHYQLDLLVSCNHGAHHTFLSEFFNNLTPTDVDFHYQTMVGGRPLAFSLPVWEEFLGCRHSNSNVIFYPSYVDPLPIPFNNITLNFLFEHLFGGHRPLNVTRFDSQRLRVMDNVLYKVIIHCLLPIVTRGMAKMRAPHSFLLYALKHRLDVNVALNTFMCITSHVPAVRHKVHMPFGHLLTRWIASKGIIIPEDELTPITHYDTLNERNLSLAGLKVSEGELRWARRRQGQQEAAAGEEEESSEGSEEEEPSVADRVAEMAELTDLRYYEMEDRMDALTLEVQATRRDIRGIRRLLQRRDVTHRSIGIETQASDYEPVAVEEDIMEADEE